MHCGVKIKKRQYSSAPLINAHYGDIFVACGELTDTLSSIYLDDNSSILDDDNITTGKDNRDLNDDNSSQELSQKEIEDMQKSGMNGTEIIKALCQKSKTFGTKTAFSQEKYIRKKLQKYLPSVQVFPVTSDLICKIYYDKSASKIKFIYSHLYQLLSFLRPDSLSRLLSSANLTAGMNVAVYDGTSGVLTAAVAEQLGKVTVFHGGNMKSAPQYSTLTHFNQNMIADVNYIWVGHFLEKGDETISSECDGKYDALVVCHSYSPDYIVPRLLRVLKPSAGVCVFAPSISPLVDLAESLRGKCVDIDVSEAWLREYQVLPERTHPHMSMNGSSGYILSSVYLGIHETDLKSEEEEIVKKPKIE